MRISYIVESRYNSFDDFSIQVTCEQTSLKLGLINVSPERAKQVESNVTETERDQLMSVCGSLMWIARSCRPGISHQLQHVEIAECNQDSHRGRHLVGQSHNKIRQRNFDCQTFVAHLG